MSEVNRNEWDDFLAERPDAHILQTGAWGVLKSGYGWQPKWVIVGNSGAQILIKRLPFGYGIGYIPKGPVGGHWGELISEIDTLGKRNKIAFIKYEPDGWESDEHNHSREWKGSFVPAATIQPKRTIVVDLEPDEVEILARMKQKTRYNIHLAEKKEVIVEESTNVTAFNSLMAVTAERDRFGVHVGRYYEDVYKGFGSSGGLKLFMASYQGTPLAAVMVFQRGRRAWYFYGASNNIERNRMPTYLVQWRALQWSKAVGCTSYDLWGVPDADEQTLEDQFEARSDGLWSVYRFKRGFGGKLMRSAGAWDKVYIPVMYRFFRWWQAKRSGGAG